MLLSAYQPSYLPWLGLFHKIAVADTFVLYDDVPYSRYGWHNRNNIAGPNGPLLLSVPVVRTKTAGINHDAVRIDQSTNWRRKHWRSIWQAYHKTPYFKEYSGDLEEIYETEWSRLVDLNLTMLELLLKFLSIETPIVRASDIGLEGAKSSRALDMSEKMNADALLFGTLGRQYADVDEFAERGIVALFQDYVHPHYEIVGRVFRPNMSVIDLLFSHGPDSRSMLLSNNPTQDDYMRTAAAVRATWSESGWASLPALEKLDQ